MINFEEIKSTSPIEYYIYSLDKCIENAKFRGSMFKDPIAIAANNSLISNYEEERKNTLSSINFEDLDMEKISVIQSLCTPESIKIWDNCMYLNALIS